MPPKHGGQDPHMNDPGSMDVVFIRDLRLPTIIGAYEFERRRPQILQLDLEIGHVAANAKDTDRLEDAVNYADVVKAIQEIMANHQFHLLESLAERIAQVVLARFGAQRIRLEVTKTGAVRNARHVGIRIERRALP
jgi:7,8-dihydroneopterin aldolase/epimerase/oxygenase